MDDLKGKGKCPACGSTSIIYNNVSDYYRCNKCKRLFFSPSYGPGDELKAGSDLTDQIFSEPPQPDEPKQEIRPETMPPVRNDWSARDTWQDAREPRDRSSLMDQSGPPVYREPLETRPEAYSRQNRPEPAAFNKPVEYEDYRDYLQPEDRPGERRRRPRPRPSGAGKPGSSSIGCIATLVLVFVLLVFAILAWVYYSEPIKDFLRNLVG